MITAAAVFVLLLVVLIFQAVGGSIASRRKSENVTADSGLRITVEDEPENWCSSYPVQLKLSVTDATLQSVQEMCIRDSRLASRFPGMGIR